jgi:hypothetical protein
MTNAKVNTAPVTIVPFNGFAKKIVSAYSSADKAQIKLREVVQVAMQQFIDTCAQANGRTEASCKALQKAIKESEVAANSVAKGLMEAKTWTEYSQSAARALYWNVDFEPSLKNDADKKLPWSKKATNQTTAAGKTVSTDRAALDKTISKAIHLARLLGLEELAATWLDAAIERLADFKEIEAK